MHPNIVGQALSIACPKYGFDGPGLVTRTENGDQIVIISEARVCPLPIKAMRLSKSRNRLTRRDTSTMFPLDVSNDPHWILEYLQVLDIYDKDWQLFHR